MRLYKKGISMKSLLIVSFLFLSISFATETKTPEHIYQKKCEMCHSLTPPSTFEEKKAQVSPFMALIMKNLTIGIDAVELPENKEELKKMVIEFIKDYSLNPHPDKAYCEEMVFKKYGYMPSLKGFISEEELDIVAPWIYEKFAPSKYK